METSGKSTLAPLRELERAGNGGKLGTTDVPTSWQQQWSLEHVRRVQVSVCSSQTFSGQPRASPPSAEPGPEEPQAALPPPASAQGTALGDQAARGQDGGTSEGAPLRPTPEPGIRALLGKRAFAGVTQDHEMSLSWSRMGPTSKTSIPIRERRSHVTMVTMTEAEMGGTEGAQPCDTRMGGSGLHHGESTKPCCFKPPSMQLSP